METLPPPTGEPELEKTEPALSAAAPRPKMENPYMARQIELMSEAFARDNPEAAAGLSAAGQKDAIAMWWVGKGYAAAFAHAAAKLREAGEERLPRLDELALDSEDEERDMMALAVRRFGKPLG